MENRPGTMPRSSFSKLAKAVKASKGKKRKCKTAYELYLEFARWVARSINPYIDFHNVWTIGLASLDGSEDDESSNDDDDEETGLLAAERAQCLLVFKKLKSEIPNFMEMVDSFHAKPNILKDLAAQMTSAARQARTTDVSGLKEIGLDYVRSMLPEGRFDPDIDPKSLKSETRGWNHKQIAALLVPINLTDEFKDDPDRVIADILAGKHDVGADLFPSFFYPPC
ncbi:hypothetical protein NP233_g7898 [Leucocoprinus birnbaumii]|uniref:Uncharacterized protein n=1 Tax=Leucocoprinus birnbaumii TaxID=56174 RepID=A0AAD5YUB7_9AGAR|nr:hypothetical protein NP233_g7898 [Leucocoprinus birnbaumii]